MTVRHRISDSDWEIFCELFRAHGTVFPSASHLVRLRSDLEHYLFLLMAANEVTNLTSIRDLSLAVWKHLYDSLVLVGVPCSGSVLDWGTGGGLPGIPLALLRRATGCSDPVSLLDSVKKKAALVEGFCDELDLSAVRVFSERGEVVLARESFDSVVMRAVAPPDRAIRWMSRRVRRFLFMTGPEQVREWRAIAPRAATMGFLLAGVAEFSLPGAQGTRFVVQFQQK